MLEKKPDRLPEARQSYQQAVTITESLSKADPSDAGVRGDLSEDIMKLSDVALRLGDRTDALSGYRRALTIREELVNANPYSAEERTQLARIYESLGAYSLSLAASERRTDDWREARRWYQLSLATFQGLQKRNRLSADYATKPRLLEKRIRTCDAALEKNSRYHDVVVVGFDEERGAVLVNDPAAGPSRAVKAAKFEKRWAGAGYWTLLVTRKGP